MLPTLAIIQARRLVLICLIFSSSFQILNADVIELIDNKKVYGQLISISGEMLFIETISKKDNSIQNIFLPRNKVLKVTDESGAVLFNDNTQQILVLKRYYDKLVNNWEELSHQYKNVKIDTIYFRSGQKRESKILSISREFLFVEKQQDDEIENSQISIEKISLKKVRQIGQSKVRFVDPKKPHPKKAKKVTYPVYSISGGLAYLHTNYDQLQDYYQEFYDKANIPFTAAKRQKEYAGLQASFEVYIKPYLSFRLTGFFYKSEKLNALGMTMAELKYTAYQLPLRPWLSAGFNGQDFSSVEKPFDTKYQWDTSKATISLGLGIDIGEELNSGYLLSVYYLPFGKGKTKINDSDLIINKELDFSMILISFAMRFNFN